MADEPKGRGVIAALLSDVLAIAGTALVSYGAWLIEPAAGYIVLGLLLLVGGVVSAVRG